MILEQILIILFNLLFGAFFCLVLRIIELLFIKKIPFIIVSFFVTFLLGIIYIISLDHFVSSFYNILFISFGFFITKSFNYFAIDKHVFKLQLIGIFIKKYFKKFLLFTINYNLIVKITQKIKKRG